MPRQDPDAERQTNGHASNGHECYIDWFVEKDLGGWWWWWGVGFCEYNMESVSATWRIEDGEEYRTRAAAKAAMTKHRKANKFPFAHLEH